MPITARAIEERTWYKFVLDNLDLVPEDSGVYWLGVSDYIIYIGSAGNLHERLDQHYYSDDVCIRQAMQFAVALCSDYKAKERQLLIAYKAKYGKLPKCNDRI